ncbi:MAG: hypothetical protein PHX02_04515 [Oscillospiraceae bacterium]|nr:hypothetical protein [Oscillospiraceae bacterium]
MVFPNEVINIIKKLESYGYIAWAVGGCVRDTLIARIPKDYDIASNCPPASVCKLFPKCVVTGAAYGTVTVITPTMPVEVTAFRLESDYYDNRHPKTVIHIDDLKTDLSRRDFTINAIAWHPHRGIFDPFGGKIDLENRLVRTVGDAQLRFGEDALRILRCLRFSSELDFDIHPSTLDAVRSLAPNLSKISIERIIKELCVLITGARPELLKILIDAGGLAHCGLNRLNNANLLALIPASLPLRLAGLIWLSLENFSLTEARRVLRGMRLDNKTINNVIRLLIALCRPLPKDKVLLKHEFNILPPEQWKGLLSLRSVLLDEDTSDVSRLLQQVKDQPWNRTMLAVSGNDILRLGVKDKKIGAVLTTLVDEVIKNPSLNNQDILLNIASKYVK